MEEFVVCVAQIVLCAFSCGLLLDLMVVILLSTPVKTNFYFHPEYTIFLYSVQCKGSKMSSHLIHKS